MIIKSAEFITSAVKPSQYPLCELPEIAFVGRSNVGKSTLINILINRKRLVKTSSTPGRTQLINFFEINRAFMFVDLPGYGYAKVPDRIRKQWGPMIETYLSQRKTLAGVVLLLDIRRIPGIDEHDLMEWFSHFNQQVIPVVTKADKLSKNRQQQQRRKIADALGMLPKDLIVFSGKSRMGKEEVWQALEEMIATERSEPPASEQKNSRKLFP
jgi:GTP-binding protein